MPVASLTHGLSIFHHGWVGIQLTWALRSHWRNFDLPALCRFVQLRRRIDAAPATPTQATTTTFSPAAGTYSGAQSVTISDATSGATIYYTTNGTTPTTSSTKYTGPISVSSTETLQAIAVATGDANSAVASATYTIGSSSPDPREMHRLSITLVDSPAIRASCGWDIALSIPVRP